MQNLRRRNKTNELGVVRQQVYIVSAFTTVVLPMKSWLVQYAGPPGVVLAGIMAYLLTRLVGYGVIFRRDKTERNA